MAKYLKLNVLDNTKLEGAGQILVNTDQIALLQDFERVPAVAERPPMEMEVNGRPHQQPRPGNPEIPAHTVVSLKSGLQFRVVESAASILIVTQDEVLLPAHQESVVVDAG